MEKMVVEKRREAFENLKEKFPQLKNEAKRCRRESDSLIELKIKTDDRKILDPRVDEIPSGEYPKLKNCKTYPLREDCNYGENNAAKRERCEYMKYYNSKSIFDPNRWICTAPE